MKAIFSVLGLLIVVAVVGLLARKQLGAVAGSPADSAASASGDVVAPAGTPRQKVQQVQQAVEGAMQARPMPDDTK